MNPVILSYYAFHKHFTNYTLSIVNTLNGSTKVALLHTCTNCCQKSQSVRHVCVLLL